MIVIGLQNDILNTDRKESLSCCNVESVHWELLNDVINRQLTIEVVIEQRLNTIDAYIEYCKDKNFLNMLAVQLHFKKIYIEYCKKHNYLDLILRYQEKIEGQHQYEILINTYFEYLSNIPFNIDAQNKISVEMLTVNVIPIIRKFENEIIQSIEYFIIGKAIEFKNDIANKCINMLCGWMLRCGITCSESSNEIVNFYATRFTAQLLHIIRMYDVDITRAISNIKGMEGIQAIKNSIIDKYNESAIIKELPTITKNDMVQLSKFTDNNFNDLDAKEVDNYFRTNLKGLTDEKTIDKFLIMAFQDEELIVNKFTFSTTENNRKKIMKVFHIFYSVVSGKPKGYANKYGNLLALYFEGYTIKYVLANWSKGNAKFVKMR